MLNRKLLEVLGRLSESEMKRLRLYLQSPYFNSGYHALEVLQLFDYVMQYRAEENHPALEKETVAAVFFPDKPFREKEKGPVDSLASDLFRMVRAFLHQMEEENLRTEGRELLTMARFYRRHSLEERFEQTIQAVRKAQAADPVRDFDYFFTQFRTEEEISHFKSIFNSSEGDLNIASLNQSLDTFFTLLKLESACGLLYQAKMSQVEEQPGSLLTQAVLSFAPDDPLLSIPAIRAYRLVYALIQNPEDESAFVSLEETLRLNKKSFSEDKYRDLQAYYRYFWRRRYLREGNPDFTRKLFELFNEHLLNGYFYIDGRLPTGSMRVITLFALKMKEFVWTKKFLDEHPPERMYGTRFPLEFYNLNYAEYHFARREFEAAKDKLSYKAFENATYSIQADLLLVKIYFDTEDELLESRIKALDQKVRRSKVAQEIKDRYYNFLKKLDKVIKYGWQKGTPKRAKLIEEIRSTTNIVEREWLLEKLQ